MHKEILQKLGLTENEVKIYLELLKSSAITAYEIGKRTGIYRAHIYDKLEYDSVDPEKYIGEWADSFDKLLVFAKIPRKRFNISTPLNENFSPDWLMVFEQSKVLHAYCVFEAKGSHMDLEKRGIENIKIECAKKHFEAISDDKIIFNVVTSKEDVLNKIQVK